MSIILLRIRVSRTVGVFPGIRGRTPESNKGAGLVRTAAALAASVTWAVFVARIGCTMRSSSYTGAGLTLSHHGDDAAVAMGARAGDLPVTMEITAGLLSLGFEAGVSVQHRSLVRLKARSRDVVTHACAHAALLCQLLLRTRRALPGVPSQGFGVGVLGGGHLGRQLVRCLLELTEVQAEDLAVSTRRPQTLGDLADRGVRCFYDNARLVSEARLLFLCCLPSQLPAVCAQIRGHLPEACVVCSLVCAVPLDRVSRLLGHSSVIRPEYRCDPEEEDEPQSHRPHINLSEQSIVRATTPMRPRDAPQHGGGVRIISPFIEAALYAALNLCTSHDLSHDQAVRLLNSLIQPPLTSGESPDEGPFTASTFVSKEYAESLPADRKFPMFDLRCVQMKETPLSHHLAASPELRTHLTSLYCAMLCADTQRARLT